MKDWLKHLIVLVGFVAATMCYFSAKMDGKVLQQGDIQKWEGMIKEQMDYHEKEGGESVWCSSMFSGMPAYTIGNPSSAVSGTSVVSKFFNVFGQRDAGTVVCSLFCMYALLLSLGCGIWTSVFGAIAFAFSSYSLIIIAAGHVSKAWTMAYMPLVLCGMVLVMKREKYLLGGLTFAIGFTMHLANGHYQIIYYFVILAAIIFAVYALQKLRKRDFDSILKSAGVMAAGCLTAAVICSSDLYAHYEVGKTSIRGRSELTSAVDNKADKSSGLDRDYAFAWSYGRRETLTLLVPNLMGGESGGTVDPKNSNLAKALRKNNVPSQKELRTYTYWGDQPFTSGPVYFGAIVCFLTLFTLVYKRSLNSSSIGAWTLFVASLFFFILSFGKNAGINNILFECLPFYNKFRTPSMALVIPQLTFAILAALALKEYMKSDNEKRFKQALYVSGGVMGGICLLLWLVPSLFLSFKCSQDANSGLPDWYISALMADREDLTSSDAFRSLMFILMAAGIMWAFSKENLKKHRKYAVMSIALLTLIDLWSVDKRYLNDSNFVKEKSKASAIKPSVADKEIKKDSDLDYRVLTLNNPFNDTRVSYFHHSIGGYNAAKNRRYQDLIEQKLEGEIMHIRGALQSVRTQEDIDSMFANTPALNMLNMKYLIYNDGAAPLTNTQALGTAWFVSSIKGARNADDEMRHLKSGDFNPKSEAIVSSIDLSEIVEAGFTTDGTIELVKSKPNIKVFKTKTTADAVAVFSDVYYQPGWKAKIDGKEAKHIRANWILRAMKIPAGDHEVEFVFYPDRFYALRKTGLVVSWMLVLAAIGLCVWHFAKNKRKETAVATASETKE